ncbi:alpha/beta hydrolase [Pseudoalteromonas sp. MMG005]|uniref:alpha/beta fold hydrolase n=1 Tax=Pseudoalteromonas sp. MMG005 TaxID=2822682 RepID=UPI001B3A201D|nr:alpha/beta hydrolase [Pseudoalteromonas sp. MMG005]MBQ4846853.1 alpha/beta hydrolase [Pseudoalteromonas sp. MMG005]
MIDEKNTIDLLGKHGFSAQIHGSGEEWVICLHGWLDNSNSFSPLVDQKKEGYRWLMIDMAGHGKSQWRGPNAHYYFVDYVYDLLTIIDALKIESCHLLGHSLGALVCGMFSALYPSRVKSLCMIEGIGMMYGDEKGTKEQLIASFRERKRIDKKTELKAFPNFETLVNLRVNVSDFTPEIARLLMLRNTKSTDGQLLLTTDPKLKTHSAFRFTLEQSKHLLNGLSVPSLLIIGDRGYGFVKKNLLTFKSCFKTLQVEIVEGGHHCHMENPQDCCALIERHLNTINGT